jgi:hypothetical protein
MHQSGWLKGMSGRFVGQFARRKLAQLLVNQRQQLIGRVILRIADWDRQVGCFVHPLAQQIPT